MNPHATHHRIRKTIKWGGAAVTVLLVVVWVGSGWYTLQWNPNAAYSLSLGNGRVSFLEIGPYPTSTGSGQRWWLDMGELWYSWELMRVQEPAGWVYLSVASNGDPNAGNVFYPSVSGWRAPFLPAVALVIAPTAIAWYLELRDRRRMRAGRCPTCNYDRTGLAAGAMCPECGSIPP